MYSLFFFLTPQAHTHKTYAQRDTCTAQCVTTTLGRWRTSGGCLSMSQPENRSHRDCSARRASERHAVQKRRKPSRAPRQQQNQKKVPTLPHEHERDNISVVSTPFPKPSLPTSRLTVPAPRPSTVHAHALPACHDQQRRKKQAPEPQPSHTKVAAPETENFQSEKLPTAPAPSHDQERDDTATVPPPTPAPDIPPLGPSHHLTQQTQNHSSNQEKNRSRR